MAAILKIYFSLLLLKQKANWLKTWWEASGWLVDKKNAQVIAIGNPKLRPSWKSVLNFFSWTERAIDSKFFGSIEVTGRSTVAKIILIGNPRWLPSCLCLLYFPATDLFTCIKSWFFRNHLAICHQISHWSDCWNVIESLFKWSRSIDCHVIYILLQNSELLKWWAFH